MNSTDYISELYDLAASQWGMFTSAQAQELGLRRNQITRMVKAGHIEPVSYGVYRYTSSAESENIEIKAAWLTVYPKKRAEERLKGRPFDAIVAGTTAAALLNAGNYHPSPYTFILHQRKQTSRKDIRFLFCRIDEEDVTREGDGLPVTTYERTVYDLLRLNEDPDLVDRFIQDASRKQLHRFDIDRMSALLSPLAARFGFPRGDGQAFASSLITRNASAAQISKTLEDSPYKMSAFLPPSVIENMKTAFDKSEILTSIIENGNVTSIVPHTLADTTAIYTVRDTISKMTLPAITQSLQTLSEMNKLSKQAADVLAASIASLHFDTREDVSYGESLPLDDEEVESDQQS